MGGVLDDRESEKQLERERHLPKRFALKSWNDAGHEVTVSRRDLEKQERFVLWILETTNTRNAYKMWGEGGGINEEKIKRK